MTIHFNKPFKKNVVFEGFCCALCSFFNGQGCVERCPIRIANVVLISNIIAPVASLVTIQKVIPTYQSAKIRFLVR